MRLHASRLAVLASLAVSACAVPPPVAQTPQQLGFPGGAREDVLGRCKRVGLVPVTSPPLPGVDSQASARIDLAARPALERVGFTVVGADGYTQAYDRFNRAVGGIYDPLLGTLRRDGYQGVISGARREYVSQEHLDCIAVLSVRSTRAEMWGQYASWDGAGELADGGANSAVVHFFGGTSGQGTLSAVSLRLELLNPEEKLLYTRDGGIQLETYFDPHHGNDESDFLVVPRAKLLQDDKRIERALVAATVPLRYTPEQILAARWKDPAIDTTKIPVESLPPLPAGASQERPPTLHVPRAQILSSVHRIALAPLALNGFAPPPGFIERIRALVHERLAPLNWEIVDVESINEVYSAAVRAVGGYYDPLTGKLDAERLHTVFTNTMKTLALTPPADAILAISLVRTQAAQRNGNAEWDAAEQQALTLGSVVKGPRLLGGTANNTAGEGLVDASSIQVLLRDPAGNTLYQARGGIELLQQLSIKTQMVYPRITYHQQFADRAPTELFKDAARNEHAVMVSLRDLALSPEQIAAEAVAAQKAQKR